MDAVHRMRCVIFNSLKGSDAPPMLEGKLYLRRKVFTKVSNFVLSSLIARLALAMLCIVINL